MGIKKCYNWQPINFTESLANNVNRFSIFNSHISQLSFAEAIDYLITTTDVGYCCLSNVHTVVEGRWNKRLQYATNSSLISFPDGMPLVKYINTFGGRTERVAGMDLFHYFCTVKNKKSHLLLGGTEENSSILKQKFTAHENRCDVLALPFCAVDEFEYKTIASEINRKKYDLIWVSLGAPKQEIFMNELYKHLNTGICLGVGGAFDTEAGIIKMAPEWMRKYSLEWLFRLSQDPKRLFKRYLVTNSTFILLYIWHLLTKKRHYG